MSYPYSAAIFDLDGTLLDTLDDLAAATNATLAAYGFPVRTREEVRLFVGNGVEKLMERALPDGHATVAHLPDGSSADFGALLADFKSRYAACCEDRTRPYPGIPALLAALPDHEKGAQAILIEAECPEKAEDEAMAVRRLGFYARCGAKDTGWTEHLFDAWFRVLVLPCCGGKVRSPEEAVRQLADCYRRTMGEPQWRRNVTFYRPDGVEVEL